MVEVPAVETLEQTRLPLHWRRPSQHVMASGVGSVVSNNSQGLVAGQMVMSPRYGTTSSRDGQADAGGCVSMQCLFQRRRKKI